VAVYSRLIRRRVEYPLVVVKLDDRIQVFELVFNAPSQLGFMYSFCRVSRLDRSLFRLVLVSLALARLRPAVLQWHSQPVF
jgi:hypothetical protein